MTTNLVIFTIVVAWALLSAFICLAVCIASSRFSARVERREPEAEASQVAKPSASATPGPIVGRAEPPIAGRVKVKAG